jgi:hypothetical protein
MPPVLRKPLPSRAAALRSLFVEQLRALPDHDSRAVRENFLTACVAGAMNASQGLAREVVRTLVGGDTWERMRLSGATITAASQCRHRSRGKMHDDCIIDLVIDVNGRQRIGVEVKLEAREGVDTEGRRQLERYVALRELDAVAFVTADAETITDTLWRHARDGRYLAPRVKKQFIRRHFVWGDFYDGVLRATQGRHASPVVIALHGLMDYLQLQPVHPLVGELGGIVAFDEVSLGVQENRLRMQEAMRSAIPLLHARGWETTPKGPRNNGALYTWREDGTPPGLDRIQASTSLTPGAFRLRFEAKTLATAKQLYADLPAALEDTLRTAFGRDVRPHLLPAFQDQQPAVDCRLPLRRLLSGVKKRESVGPQLAKALIAATEAVTSVRPRR